MKRDQAILAAMQEIPLLPEMEPRLPILAKELVLLSDLALNNDRPSAKKCSDQKALKEITKLDKHLERVADHIKSMHRTAIEPFEPSLPHPMMFFYDVTAMREKISQVLATFTINPDKEIIGYPRSVEAQMVMKQIDKLYTMLTGTQKSYTVNDGQETGVFLKFTQNVFDALGIKAKAPYMIRQLREKDNCETPKKKNLKRN